jgi:tetratricopeptide (TPR) repeat protein
LEPLKNSGQIITWHDRVLVPGAIWEKEIDSHLNTSDIILLLVSSHFMSSNYCYGKEMSRALVRRATEEVHVIPIILRPVDWKETPLGDLHVLPRDGKPITRWFNRDEAFLDVVSGIRRVIATSHSQRTKRYWIIAGDDQYNVFYYGEALFSYERALQLDPVDARLQLKVGDALLCLGQYENALNHYRDALHLYEKAYQDGKYSSTNFAPYYEVASLHRDIADILHFLLERFDEAEKFYEEYRSFRRLLAVDCSIRPDTLKRFEGLSRAMSLLVDAIYTIVLERHIDSIGVESYGNALTRSRTLTVRNRQKVSTGRMTVREVVRRIGLSSEYRDRFITSRSMHEGLELCYKHFLGREMKAEDLRYASEIAQSQGFDTLIDLLIDSDEYAQTFGEKNLLYATRNKKCFSYVLFSSYLDLGSTRCWQPILRRQAEEYKGHEVRPALA